MDHHGHGWWFGMKVTWLSSFSIQQHRLGYEDGCDHACMGWLLVRPHVRLSVCMYAILVCPSPYL